MVFAASRRAVLAACLALAAVPAGLWAAPAQAADKVAKFTTLDWEPFSGEKLANKGVFIAAITQALEKEGWKVEVTEMPWKRAVDTAVSDSSYAGILPVYLTDVAGLKGFFASAKVMESPLGLVERKDAPLGWQTLADLGKTTIGTVLGYTNTTDFDAAVAAGKIKVETAPDDLSNIKKVGAGRIKAAVIDRTVLNYLLAHDPSAAAYKDKLQFDAKPLENKGIFIALRDNALGHAVNDALVAGVKSVNIDDLMKQTLAAK